MTFSSQPLIGRVRHARVPAFVFGTRLPESAVPRFAPTGAGARTASLSQHLSGDLDERGV